MKIVVIGANHAGTSFLRTLAKLDKNKKMEMTVYDQNNNISFLGCGIALWVGGEFKSPECLFYSNIQELTDLGVKVKMEHKVIKVDQEKKIVVVKNLKTNEEFTDTYDKLVCASGSWPAEMNIKGIDSKNVFLSKLFQHAEEIVQQANSKNVNDVVIVGAGYIGIELVEAFHKHGKKVTLIDMSDRVIANYFDEEFTKPMEEKMVKEGIKLQLGETLKEFEANANGEVTAVVTDKGKYKADIVIVSVGIRPQTDYLKADKIANGAIKVNEFQQSISDENLFVLGDAAALYHNSYGDYKHVALATNAVKTGVVAAFKMAGSDVPLPGITGTNGINVFGFYYASTGISETTAQKDKIPFKAEYLKDKDRPEFMHYAEDVCFKIVYDPKTLRLLGAQVGSAGTHNHSEIIQVMSLAIQKKMCLPEIALMDVYFLPHFNKPFNFVLQTILNAIGMKY